MQSTVLLKSIAEYPDHQEHAAVPLNFRITSAPYPAPPVYRLHRPLYVLFARRVLLLTLLCAAVRPQVNPQTVEYCALVGLDDYFAKFMPRSSSLIHDASNHMTLSECCFSRCAGAEESRGNRVERRRGADSGKPRRDQPGHSRG